MNKGNNHAGAQLAVPCTRVASLIQQADTAYANGHRESCVQSIEAIYALMDARAAATQDL